MLASPGIFAALSGVRLFLKSLREVGTFLAPGMRPGGAQTLGLTGEWGWGAHNVLPHPQGGLRYTGQLRNRLLLVWGPQPKVKSGSSLLPGHRPPKLFPLRAGQPTGGHN